MNRTLPRGTNRHDFAHRRGVALVLTLIMLSVITFLTVAFLTLARREKSSMTTSSDQTVSKLMVDAAQARAQSELVARIMAQTNMLAADFLISRNFINPIGYDNNVSVYEPTNVNYDFLTTGGALNPDQLARNIGNLLYDPRPPVFITTNSLPTAPLDFRFYFDYNRNGRFDTNGWIDELDINGNSTGRKFFAWGDPEWIGVLARPEFPHSGTNLFIGRYVYMAFPEGNTLDLNWIHNYSKGNGVNGFPPAMLADGFMRNQGFGPWELNLAGFLYHLNTNIWSDYIYNPYDPFASPNPVNSGTNFDDALGILRYRYNSAYFIKHVPDLLTTLGPPSTTAFTNDYIDGFANGPVLFTKDFLTLDQPELKQSDKSPDPRWPWPGSKSTNQFRDMQELLSLKDTNLYSFRSNLFRAISQSNSYDRYTWQRMIAQMGTYSAPATNYTVVDRNFSPVIRTVVTNDSSGNVVTNSAGEMRLAKIHLNYDNLTPTNNDVTVPQNLWTASQTNFLEWEPLKFFTNVAQRLIDQALDRTTVPTNYILGGRFVGNDFSLTNIQVYPTNQYTPTLHRLLQVSANIYAATTNGCLATNRLNGQIITNLPYVFRPTFTNYGTNNLIYISGYEEVTTNWSPNMSQFIALGDLTNAALVSAAIATVRSNKNVNIYGIPWVVSAKKGYPNFNDFASETWLQVTRKLEVFKNRADGPTIGTNVMYLFTMPTFVEARFWNSYMSNYPRSVQVFVTNTYQAVMTNEARQVVWRTNATNIARNFTINSWPGAVTTLRPRQDRTNSFVIVAPQTTNLPPYQIAASLPGSKLANYQPPAKPGTLIPTTFDKFDHRSDDWFYYPILSVDMTNRLFAALIDTAANRVIDFVNLELTNRIDITTNLYSPELAPPNQDLTERSLWDTNRIPITSTSARGMTVGIQKQMEVSTQQGDTSQWRPYNLYGQDITQLERQRFVNFLRSNTSSTNQQAPFNPTKQWRVKYVWQANDPLVHYMPDDLIARPPDIANARLNTPYLTVNLAELNMAYEPWGGKHWPADSGSSLDSAQGNDYNLLLKDPQVRRSDDWEFPTNKFPNIGWLGRVHRGTPWQTLYLKAGIADTNAWREWSGSYETHATNDWRMLDIFTIAPYDNAARGLLSVNQANIASWSAVLSGVIVETNFLPNGSPLLGPAPQNQPLYDWRKIEPFPIPGTSVSHVETILNAINNYRATNAASGYFHSVGQILGVPELTTQSPYLNTSDKTQTAFGISDAAYERIPQQIMSLLKVGESRFVIYSLGQSLKPAANGILPDAPSGRPELQNVCTNYQITGEIATRTVLRVDGSPEKPRVVIESYNVLPAE